MATTINEDKLLAINDSLIQMAGNDAAIQNLQEQVSILNRLAGEGVFEVSNTYDLVIHNDAEFNDVITKYRNGYTDGAGVSHPDGHWYNSKNLPAASVLIMGALTLTDSVTVPESVKALDFQGGSSLIVTSTLATGLTFSGDTVVTGLNMIVNGGSITGNAVSGGNSFTNCSVVVTGGSIGSAAFSGAKSLCNCQVKGSITSGFTDCKNLVNCTFEGGSENAIGFTGCRKLSNCTASMTADGSRIGYSSCSYMTGCLATGGAKGYDSCSYMSSCTTDKATSGSQYPCNLWFEYTNKDYPNVTLPSTSS